MKLEERVQADLVQAMKQKESLKVSVLRMLKAAIKNKEIEIKKELSPAEANKVLQTLVKQRTESIETFTGAGRDELARKETEERRILESYLPAAVDEGEIEIAVRATIEALGASSPKDMGAVMKEVLGRLQATGKTVDGKTVSVIVKARLEELAAS